MESFSNRDRRLRTAACHCAAEKYDNFNDYAIDLVQLPKDLSVFENRPLMPWLLRNGIVDLCDQTPTTQ